MTKQEFERRIRMAESKLLSLDKTEPGVCEAIEDNFEVEVVELFYHNFSPCEVYRPELKHFHAGYWLDKPRFILDKHWNQNDGMGVLERRLLFLESFKGFCETHELYKDW